MYSIQLTIENSIGNGIAISYIATLRVSSHLTSLTVSAKAQPWQIQTLRTLAEEMELQHLRLMCLSQASVIAQRLQKLDEKQNSCAFIFIKGYVLALNLSPAFAG